MIQVETSETRLLKIALTYSSEVFKAYPFVFLFEKIMNISNENIRREEL